MRETVLELGKGTVADLCRMNFVVGERFAEATQNEIVLRELGFEQLRPLIYGAILIASILFLPNGLESLVQKFTRKEAKS